MVDKGSVGDEEMGADARLPRNEEVVDEENSVRDARWEAIFCCRES